MTHEAVHDAVTHESDDRLAVVARPPLQRRPGGPGTGAPREVVDLTQTGSAPGRVLDLTRADRAATLDPADPRVPDEVATLDPTAPRQHDDEAGALDPATSRPHDDEVGASDRTAPRQHDRAVGALDPAAPRPHDGEVGTRDPAAPRPHDGEADTGLSTPGPHDGEADTEAAGAETAGAAAWGSARRAERPAGVDPRFALLAATPAGDPARGTLRRTLIEAHLPLVHHLAQRFRGRGEPYDDLVQVGTIGLLHAVDRFDPERGGSFTAFAVPTILGEIRRHFRDRGWAMRVPRRLQDLGRRVSEAREALTHKLDRSPTAQEIATYLDADLDLVLEALETASAYSTVPLPTTPDEAERYQQPFTDSGLELVEQRETLRPLLARLPVREQRILDLRFGRGLSQSQIAAEVGVSQMHVSRLLAKSLSTLRTALVEHD